MGLIYGALVCWRFRNYERFRRRRCYMFVFVARGRFSAPPTRHVSSGLERYVDGGSQLSGVESLMCKSQMYLSLLWMLGPEDCLDVSKLPCGPGFFASWCLTAIGNMEVGTEILKPGLCGPQHFHCRRNLGTTCLACHTALVKGYEAGMMNQTARYILGQMIPATFGDFRHSPLPQLLAAGCVWYVGCGSVSGSTGTEESYQVEVPRLGPGCIGSKKPWTS